MGRYDSIIVGAGHNGLVCGAYLARNDQKVLILEAADEAGGLAASREFHPGYTTSIAQSVSHFSEQVSRDLNLAAYGYDRGTTALPLIGLGASGKHVVVEAKSVQGVGDDDAMEYTGYTRQLEKFADALQPFWLKTIPRIGPGGLRDVLTFAHLGLSLRKLGKADMREFMRVASLPARDLVEENFSSELLKATLSWDMLTGAKMAPRSPNSSVLLMLYRLAEQSRGTHTIPSGGVPGLIAAIQKSAQASGVEVRCSTAVEKITVAGDENGLQVTGVTTTAGEQISADRVISATDPTRTFIDMIGVEYLDIGFTNRIRRLRCDGFVGKLHLALSKLPGFTGLDTPNARMIIAPNVDAIEFAYDDAKYGRCSDDPVMEIVLPSLIDASLAPDGGHVLSANVMYVPRALKGGWTAAAREQILNRCIEVISAYAPDIRDCMVHAEFLTPEDLENEYRITGGHWHHTEIAMDQMLMMRPTYEAAQYRTPIPGLYLCGAGCHPGGDITGAAGHNAAHEILR